MKIVESLSERRAADHLGMPVTTWLLVRSAAALSYVILELRGIDSNACAVKVTPLAVRRINV